RRHTRSTRDWSSDVCSSDLGRNPFLIREELDGGTPGLQPVSYSIGKPSSIRLAKPRNAVVLTGANSGGKTTLLNTMAAIHILAQIGRASCRERRKNKVCTET